ncbi:ornithine carbamoyltransferase [Bombella pollinis]|uniref:Ornithine carbamoyltransferase n=1 Tax=Bombella pollinis TaxID=2967337 RepID=A0ABT3WRJ6_9PROT|nr:ornithine carbamoyltransferase [Bombella pollinis]MCT6837772.1 ornithine carbamoyltransferase [Bifidobacteriales bacterium]MCT6854989.1 ornithine carbamoyltransferase [Bombella apis]MCX5620327.1 ornithine carbamoyltransferase [Bombella pollinis]
MSNDYTSSPRHFLDIKDHSTETLRHILDLAAHIKALQQERKRPLCPGLPLAGRALGLMMSRPSTRTRVSFEVGMKQLGGTVNVLSPADMQLGRGESIADTARVLSRFLDVITLRTGTDANLRELARWSDVPVINGLTPVSHPVQILADILTFEEHRGSITGKKLAWIGDGNNVATSMIEAAARLGFSLHLATPEGEFMPSETAVNWARAQGGDIQLTHDPREAAAGADAIVTDTWVSMGDKDAEKRHQIFRPYHVDEALMALAAPEALFMHCLPAHIGEEVSKVVFEGPASVVFDEAENRLHAQKGLLLWCLGEDDLSAYQG